MGGRGGRIGPLTPIFVGGRLGETSEDTTGIAEVPLFLPISDAVLSDGASALEFLDSMIASAVTFSAKSPTPSIRSSFAGIFVSTAPVLGPYFASFIAFTLSSTNCSMERLSSWLSVVRSSVVPRLQTTQ